MRKKFRLLQEALSPGELNEEQLTELAKLCFDLAKGAFAITIIQTTNGTTFASDEIVKISFGGLWGNCIYLPWFAIIKNKGGEKK